MLNIFKKKKQAPKGPDLASEVKTIFDEFKNAYASEWDRLDENEKYYRCEHWDIVSVEDEKEPKPVTPVVQSAVENIKSDLMDHYPEAIIRPESPEDEQIAKILQEIIRQNHDAANYKKEWWKLSHDLLVGGYMVQETGYDDELNNGLGGAYNYAVNAHNIMFDPLASEVQDGRAVIKFEQRSLKWLNEHYPAKAPFAADEYTDLHTQDDHLSIDTQKRALLIEYWWREYEDGRYRVHMAKMCGNKILEDSREVRPEGYYAHGKYPFTVTPLFMRKDSCLGYGLVDMFKSQQLYSDKLNQIVMKNALMASRNKLLVTESSGFDIGDLSDWSKDVHQGDTLNGVTWFSTPPLPAYILSYIQQIQESIRTESGANSFSQGNTSGGVTAASAISALQEMSSKRSRMAANQMMEAYKEAVRMEVELEREFNLLPRDVFVKDDDGRKVKQTFDASMLSHTTQSGNDIPIEFSISIKVQRENRWSVIAHNELMLQMVQLGVLQPQQAVELMEFEGKESVQARGAQAQQAAMAQQQQMQQIQGDLGELPTIKPDVQMEPAAVM